MSLPYFWRLFFICSASFFLIHAITGLVVRVALPLATLVAGRMSSQNAARSLFALRMLPVCAAAFAVLGLCIPSYLQFEPGSTTEEVGLLCVFVAALGVSLCVYTLARVLVAAAATVRFTRICRKSGRGLQLPGGVSPVLVIEGDKPVLAMAGAVHPRIIISRGVLQTLSQEQLDAAIRHELAHRKSADNFKRLLLLFAPEILPFSHSFAAMDHAWVRFSEFAADDSAVGDDARRSLTLASALVRVARMGVPPRLSPLCTRFVSGDSDCANSDLFVRVDRLLRTTHVHEKRPSRLPALAGVTVAAAGLALAVFLFVPATLHSVHEVIEQLIH
jgi:Zn-dependent protease with chaperone function